MTVVEMEVIVTVLILDMFGIVEPKVVYFLIMTYPVLILVISMVLDYPGFPH